jgi:hypothetical protein
LDCNPSCGAHVLGSAPQPLEHQWEIIRRPIAAASPTPIESACWKSSVDSALLPSGL